MRRERARAQVSNADILIAGVDQPQVFKIQQEAAVLIELTTLIRIESIRLGERARWRIHVVERLRDQFAEFIDEDALESIELILSEKVRCVGLDELLEAREETRQLEVAVERLEP